MRKITDSVCVTFEKIILTILNTYVYVLYILIYVCVVRNNTRKLGCGEAALRL